MSAHITRYVQRDTKKSRKQGFAGLHHELDYQDSNLDKQNQNLLCYHYTIVQSSSAFLEKRCKGSVFYQYPPNIFKTFFVHPDKIITFVNIHLK